MTDRDRDGRPDPDALLALSKGDRRGRLKVFLGAAPGVGKTFAMLQNARRLKSEGVDVLIGLVETHGRKDTEALLDGLDVLPRRMVDYQGRALGEFDLDAALARKPKLIVVDELAHTNAPDCRHPKRWQDVEELLDAGLDVWSALNIQHLESLADVVSRITGVVVRETVPDTVVQGADDVVLVDITPDELIQRLHDGKVYLPATAKRATQNFFTVGNLTALRELALRRTADRVDDQMVDLLRQKAIEGPWGSSEKLLACVDADAASEKVIRRTAQLATRLNGDWIAVHVERAAMEADPARSIRLAELFALAERLGAQTLRVGGTDVAAELLRVARRENISQIVVAEPRRTGWRKLFARPLSDRLAREAGDIDVHVMQAGDAPARPRPAWRAWSRDGLGVEIAAAAAAVTLAVLIGHGLARLVALPNLSMIFLAAVLACAVLLGVRAAVIASFASFLAYNFFFIEPLYSFTVAQPHELLALFVFLAAAILTGSLAGRVREQRDRVIRHASATQALYDFSRRLAAATSTDEVIWTSVSQLHKTFGRRAALLTEADGALRLQGAWPPDVELDAAEMSAARLAAQKREAAGAMTGTMPRLNYQFRPLATARGLVGVCGFEPPSADARLTGEDERTLEAVLDQTALALDRAVLAREAVKAASAIENEKVRDALLASLSHDLRTPLATISGASSALRELDAQLSPQARADLLQSIDEEADRLSRFVTNLLDMSRIEAGGLKAKREPVDVADVVNAAAERCRRVHPGKPVRVSLAADLPFLRGDGRLLEQVLFNLLDNAQKYGGESGAALHGRAEGEGVALSVTDEGPGVKPADLERIFEKFYRGGRADGRQAGTGLGLSICRGLIEAMGGTIVAQSPAARRRGTRMLIRLPAAPQPPAEETQA